MYFGIEEIPRWVLQGQSIPRLAQGPSGLIRACVDWEGESSHGEAISAAAVLGIALVCAGLLTYWLPSTEKKTKSHSKRLKRHHLSSVLGVLREECWLLGFCAQGNIRLKFTSFLYEIH